MSLPIEQLTPKQIVAELDKYIVGQEAAKRAVAIALRNRYRRQQLPEADRNEVTPKNILMMGPTGVGKTEIARRLAQLARAPFVKVEATKFTEVGYVGRDVDAMVRDLTAGAVRIVEKEMIELARPAAKEAALESLIDMVELKVGVSPDPVSISFLTQQPEEIEEEEAPQETREDRRARIRKQIEAGEHDDLFIDVETEEQGSPFLQVFGNQGMEEVGLDMNSMMSPFGGGSSKRSYRKAKVGEALPLLIEVEARNSIDQHTLHKEAIERAEQTGIIFIDELDKVAMPSSGAGPDVSREGVQRDLLPVIEGSTVQTKFGPVDTEHVLFIAAGAFHVSKPSDLIPELQGRLPIRVTLDSLNEEDFCRILREPKNALTKQYKQLLAVEGVKIEFDDGALDEIAHMAAEVNAKAENIGARRLHTMVERLLGDLMFDAPENAPESVKIDAGYVREKLRPLVDDLEASKTVL